MIIEVGQVKAWFLEQGYTLDSVPEGDYIIPLGYSLTPTHVEIDADGKIFIGDAAEHSRKGTEVQDGDS